MGILFSRNFLNVRTDGIDEVDGLAGASAVAVSPGGAHVYVTSLSDNAVAVLSIATADLNVTLSESEEPIKLKPGPISLTNTSLF